MRRLKSILTVVPACGFLAIPAFAQQADIVIADFEGPNYGAWKTTGTAFENTPARGTLLGQMKVDGFQGKGLVNSFNGGDNSTGTLTSPPFKLERKYLQFLVGGGGWEGKTCVNLLIDGKAVRTATGPNTEPGGSEHLQPAQWDVTEFVGREATLQIVDDATGGWGHINVDQIVQSDKRIAVPIAQQKATREIAINQPYLNLPVKNGAPKRHVNITLEGKTVRAFEIELADGQPDWWAFLDTTPFQGKTIALQVDRLPENSTGLSSIDQTKEVKNGATLYQEPLRPQFHFTSRHGWLNDPNGLVFYDGEYHLFYQHNPFGWNWGNMSWGHAVSRDLVHWRELPVALHPDESGTMFSGSAVVDWNNTAGFQTGKDPALVAMYTAAGKPFTQGIAYSNDRGRTWTKYEHNPVLAHIVAENRDPKVVWYAPLKMWIMTLYLDHNDYAIFGSSNLKEWRKLSGFTLPGDTECPNFFPMPLEGNTNAMHWVFYGASGVYVVGKFNGRQFAPESSPRRLQNGNCWYASQVYSDIPATDGRTIMIPWGRLPSDDIFRGMTFNQMMGLPVELKLRSSSDGPFLEVQPVAELAALRGHSHEIKPQPLTSTTNPLGGISGDLFEIEAEIAVGDAKEIKFDLRGVPVVYDAARQTLSCLGLESKVVPKDGILSLRMFVDRRSVDIFGDGGRLYMPMAIAISSENRTLGLICNGGIAEIIKLKVYELKSAW